MKKNTFAQEIANCIDLTDANLEEISTPESGRIQGGWGGWGSCGSCFSFHVSSRAFAGLFGSCSCENSSCSSCSCESCSCGSCSCESCSCGSCSCGSCSFGSCGGFWD